MIIFRVNDRDTALPKQNNIITNKEAGVCFSDSEEANDNSVKKIDLHYCICNIT